MNMEEPTKQIIDTLSFATVLGTISAILPPLSALFTIIWVSIRIWETDTVQAFRNKSKTKRSRDRGSKSSNKSYHR